MVMLALPLAWLVPAMAGTAWAQEPTTTTTPDTEEGRCQYERGGQVEVPSRRCDDDVHWEFGLGALVFVGAAGLVLKVRAQ